MAVESIEASIDIDASISRVWHVLTNEGLVAEWLGCMNFKPVIGTVFYMQPNPERRQRGDIDGATHCELVELLEPMRMRFSWFMPGTPKTHVTISVSQRTANSVSVSLSHDGWDQFEAEQIRGLRDMLAGGWVSCVLPGLKKIAESPTSFSSHF